MSRWSDADARAWGSAHPWVCGFNFLPSSAVNFLEMWQAGTFDRATIERELGWAAGIGFNAIRVNLPFLVWRDDRDGLLERLDWLAGVAAKLGIDTVPCPFDDCGFGGFEPEAGPQPDPVADVHNSRAVASPGRARVLDRRQWPDFEAYLRDVVGAFRSDRRVLFWDLYNEPGNRMIFGPHRFDEYDAALGPASHALMEAAFGWARDVAPEQPLTVGAWNTPAPGSDAAPYQTEADRSAVALSDIVSFHAYARAQDVEAFIDHLANERRPLFCTEWMARPIGSLIADQLPMLHARDVGCFQWGLVKGRTQTHLPWPATLVEAHGGTASRDVWFHDLLETDGRPYDQSEIDVIRRLTSPARAAGRDRI